MRDIIPAAKQLMERQEAAWINPDTSPLLLGTASLLLVFGLLSFIKKAFTTWNAD